VFHGGAEMMVAEDRGKEEERDKRRCTRVNLRNKRRSRTTDHILTKYGIYEHKEKGIYIYLRRDTQHRYYRPQHLQLKSAPLL